MHPQTVVNLPICDMVASRVFLTALGCGPMHGQRVEELGGQVWAPVHMSGMPPKE